MNLRAVIFDLDGVLTDTAEYHYLSWQKLADEENLVFDRQVNERLRGVSRQQSLKIILNGRSVADEQFAEMMARKNRYYVDYLQNMTPDAILPGMLNCLADLKQRGIRIALGSASKNAHTVLQRLNIIDYFDVIGDGNSVELSKPAPDLFLFATQQLGLTPDQCVVVEDAASGIEAALAAGIWTVGIGPAERVARAHLRFADTAALAAADIIAQLQQQIDETQGWLLTETDYNLDKLAHKETIFTVGNGYLCSRGVYEETYPGETRTTFVHGVFDDMPLRFTELANVPDWTHLTILIDGQPFAMNAPGSKVIAYRRWLDLRSGSLHRQITWRSPQGQIVRLEFQRWCSFAEPHLLTMQCTIVPLNFNGMIEIRSDLMGHTDNRGLRHIDIVQQGVEDKLVWLHSRTRSSNIDIALAMRMQISGVAEDAVQQTLWPVPGQPTQVYSVSASLAQPIVISKHVSLVTGLDDAKPVAKALRLLSNRLDTATIWAEHWAEWSRVWNSSDVVIEGDNDAQLAVRFNIYHLLIAASKTDERVSIGAKTMSGFGYNGHVFWDTEVFILPLFALTQPQIARNLLMYRYHNLAGARAKASANGFAGAQFPWESAVDGTEVCPRWIPNVKQPDELIRITPADSEIHITADIAYGCWFYWQATGDHDWLRDYGAEIILSGALFWSSRAERDAQGRYHYCDVIGPDEYHEHVDDNIFTNQMAVWHIATAQTVLQWLAQHAPDKHTQLVTELNLDATCLAQWQDICQNTLLDDGQQRQGLLEQFAGYFNLRDADIDELRDPNRTESMYKILGVEGVSATQIIKQPDVLMLQFLLPQCYSQQQLQANWEYYNPRTEHEFGSSLGPSISAIMACRLGLIEQAYTHFICAANTDIKDLRLNAGEGMHAASAGGVWQAVVLGFAGLEFNGEQYRFNPRLPKHWQRLRFALRIRGEDLMVDIVAGQPAVITKR